MRLMVMVGLLVGTALAGCVDVEPPGAGSLGAEPLATGQENASTNQSLAEHPQFCTTAASCDFWDDQYHQYVVYDLDTVTIDTVIVPPAGGMTPDNLAASRQAVQAWSDGIEELAAPWLADNFTMTVAAVGVDVPSLDAVQDPEIVVISSSASFLVGIGLEPKQLACIIIGEEIVEFYGGHDHNGNLIFAADCTNTGFTCFAINVGAFDPRGLYDLIAHEVGHCLGPGHVGDAGDFRSRYAPVDDIMSYQDDPAHVHCVSNMNARVIEGVYAHLLDRPSEAWLPRGSFLPFDIIEYAQVDCSNPPGV
jgi:hypothetical protein